MSNTEKKTKMTEHEDLIRDLTSEQMCEEHLPRIFELSSFKEKELLFLKSAFESGATIAKNRTQYRSYQETSHLLKQIDELKADIEKLVSANQEFLGEIALMVSQSEKLCDEKQIIENKIEELKKENEMLERNCTRAQDHAESLLSELTSLKAKMEEAKDIIQDVDNLYHGDESKLKDEDSMVASEKLYEDVWNRVDKFLQSLTNPTK